MSLWAKIETAPEAASFFAWNMRFGNELFKVAPWFLKRKNEKARTVPCPHNCECLHRVTEDGRGVCDCGACEEISLSEEDVQVWESNWSGLGGKVREAFKLEHKVTGFGVRHVWQVGSFGGDALQVILVVQPERSGFNEAIARLAAMLKVPFAVLTPTAVHHDIESRDLLGRVGAGLFDLESSLAILPGGLVARRGSGELFVPLLPEKRVEIKRSEARTIFELFRKLRTERGIRSGRLDDVFRAMVLDGANQRIAAKTCGCSEGTISARVRTVEKRFGMSVERLRMYASEILEFESAVKGDRRRRKRDGALEEIDDQGAGEEREADT